MTTSAMIAITITMSCLHKVGAKIVEHVVQLSPTLIYVYKESIYMIALLQKDGIHLQILPSKNVMSASH